MHWSEVPTQMAAWTWNNKYAHERGEEAIRQGHIDFETIHPFEDGNGRTGRMLMSWQRKKAGLEPLLIRASERWEYYQWFKSR